MGSGARETITRREWLLSARRRLSERGISAAHLVAQVLLAHVVEVPRERLLAHDELALSEVQRNEAEALLERRLNGTPLAYLVEAVEFYGHRLRVTPEVLIPRNETEHLVEFVLSQRPAEEERGEWTLLDIGTGSGCLPIAIGLSDPGMRAIAVDVSDTALTVAADNVFLHGLDERVGLVHGDGFDALLQAAYEPESEAATACMRVMGTHDLRGMVDVIVSNPPYVDPADAVSLRPEVLAEPSVALFAGEPGEGGSAVQRLLIDEARRWLRPGGWLVLELGLGQAPALAEWAASLPGWRSEPEIRKDLAGIERVFALERRDGP